MKLDDVRMKGFHKRMSFSRAVRLLGRVVEKTGSETCGIDDALGRVLCSDVVAKANVPYFDRSAMDGYAVVDSDTYGAGDYNPISLEVVGETVAGGKRGRIRKGEALRIMTGAMMPRGANAVVKVENTADGADGKVDVVGPVSRGENVSFAGEDVGKGDVVFTGGRVLKVHDVGVLASMGVGRVRVRRMVRVGIVVTGSELVSFGDDVSGGKIVDVNSHVLLADVKNCGAEVSGVAVVGDDSDAIGDAIVSSDADIIVVTGGTSCGKEDHVPRVVSRIGEVLVHGVGMRPAGPLGFGRVCGKLVFMLPGNPLAVCVGFDFFVRRAIFLMMGADEGPVIVKGKLVRKAASVSGRTDIFRVRYDEGEVEPLRAGGGAILSSMVRANGYLVVGDDVEGYDEEEMVDVRLFL